MKTSFHQFWFSKVLMTGLAMLLSLYASSQHAFIAHHFQPRAGWPQVQKLVKKGHPVRIVYFGGSITEARGGWREQSLALLQQAYPKATFTHINAGVGGTGSDLGAFRLERDVLRHSPHLVLIEFAVNDNGKEGEAIQQSMEGIVSKIKAHNKNTDIGFVYTVEKNMAAHFMEGRLPPSIAAMEALAAHYHIPTILLAAPVLERLRQGKLVMAGPKPFSGDTVFFSRDNVHPFAETGHKLYAEAFLEAVPHLLKKKGSKPFGTTKPLTPNPFQEAVLLPVSNLLPTEGWKMLTAKKDSFFLRFTNRMDTVLQGSSASAPIQFSFTGTRFGLYDVIGPGSGAYVISIDGKDTVVNRFDRYCTYWRMHYFLLPELPDGVHRVSIRVASKNLDKEKILGRPIGEDEVEKYRAMDCYPAALLLVGKLVE